MGVKAARSWVTWNYQSSEKALVEEPEMFLLSLHVWHPLPSSSGPSGWRIKTQISGLTRSEC